MNEKIKRLLQELKEECEKEQIDILCGAYIRESQEQVLIVGGREPIKAILLMRLLAVLESEACDCPDCRRIKEQKEDTFEEVKFDEGDAEFFKSLNRKMRGV